MEYIDVLNNHGQKTGKIKPKPDVHRDGDWHRSVHIWLVDENNNILLQLRSKNKENFPNMYDISVAGHVSSGEDSLIAAQREILEEIGYHCPTENLKFIGELTQEFVLNNGTYFDKEYNDVYILSVNSKNLDFKIQKEELDGILWLPCIEFEKWVNIKKSNLVPHYEEYELLLRNLK